MVRSTCDLYSFLQRLANDADLLPEIIEFFRGIAQKINPVQIQIEPHRSFQGAFPFKFPAD
ncbi:MAG: hypothetical protein C3F06_02595 [Candidatus Methanoperedenaceae archaeon]|nr:MAG: hypothetical protein C3F06_02595 [Candidatus Methanoperedenaceae archaeon]